VGFQKLRFELVFDDEPGVPLTDVDLKLLGGGVRVPVAGTINGSPFRTRAFRMGGVQGIRFNQQILKAADAGPGDAVVIELWRDDEERVVDVPPDLAEALGDLRAAFDAASYTQRKEWAQSVAEAKKAETRERRVAKVVAEVKARR
jgi:antitoxin component of MazEF toxin-antitoxin module